MTGPVLKFLPCFGSGPKLLQTKFVSKFLAKMVSSTTKCCLSRIFAIYSFLTDQQGKFNTVILCSDFCTYFLHI